MTQTKEPAPPTNKTVHEVSQEANQETQILDWLPYAINAAKSIYEIKQLIDSYTTPQMMLPLNGHTLIPRQKPLKR